MCEEKNEDRALPRITCSGCLLKQDGHKISTFIKFKVNLRKLIISIRNFLNSQTLLSKLRSCKRRLSQFYGTYLARFWFAVDFRGCHFELKDTKSLEVWHVKF